MPGMILPLPATTMAMARKTPLSKQGAAVRKPASGNFSVRRSTDSGTTVFTLGQNGDYPVGAFPRHRGEFLQPSPIDPPASGRLPRLFVFGLGGSLFLAAGVGRFLGLGVRFFFGRGRVLGDGEFGVNGRECFG